MQQLIIDQYTFLDYKGVFDSSGRNVHTSPEFWVGEDNMRRLQAYMVLESYKRNNARHWLNLDNSIDSDRIRDARREYGEPHVVIQTALSSLLGEDQSIVVPAATETDESSDERKFLDQLLDWAKKERLKQKMHACEENAVALGDGVYVLGWNDKLNRPRLQVWDPGFYFPEWDESDPSEEFPRIVHIAYDYMEFNKEKQEDEKFLRRITWELVTLEEIGQANVSDRKWNGDGETTETVLYSDMTWKYEDVRGDESDGPVYTLDLENVHHVTEDEKDLEIDWIPVIHISNTETDSGERFGISVLSPILQIVDDIISTDTDLQAASATTGSPPLVVPDLVVSGSDADNSITSYGPGEVISTSGEGGQATMIDTSRSLVALTGFVKDLLSRMSVNGRIPESLLGRVKPNEVPSGIALTLSFSPHSAMVRAMRMVREDKYATLLKMVSRFYLQNGDLKKIFPAEIKFGSFLPADMQEVMTIVQNLYTAKAISLETAVRMMIDAGFPIDEVSKEIERIHKTDFEGAGLLMGVTANVNDALRYLGLPSVSEAEAKAARDAMNPPPPPGSPGKSGQKQQDANNPQDGGTPQPFGG